MSNREKIAVVFLLLLSAVLLCYGNTFRSSWHFDDSTSILQNPGIHLDKISLVEIKNVLQTTSSEIPRDRPVAYLSFAFNWYWGKQAVFGYHLTNLLIHTITSFFIFLFILECYRTKGLQRTERNTAFYTALLAAMLWALHPIQIQAVTYIVQRMASMAAMFYIVGLWLYLRARLTADRRRYVLFSACLVCYLLAVGTKQNTVVFPVTLLLIELIFIQQIRALRSMNTLLLCLLLAISATAVYFILNWKYDLTGQAFANRSFTLVERVLTEPRVVLHYLSQIVYPLPWRFSVIHDVKLSHSLFNPPTTLFSILTIIGLVVFALAKRKEFPILSFGLLFYFLNHVVESTVLNLELMFEHRNYLPSSFLFWAPASFVVGFMYRNRKRSRPAAVSIFILTVFCVGSLGWWTRERNSFWASEETLWADALAKYPQLARPYLALAASAMEKDQNELALRLYMESLKRRDPSPGKAKFLAYHNMAHIYVSGGNFKKAEEYYKKCLTVEPESPLARYNLAHTLVREGKYREAETILDSFLSANKMKQNENFLAIKGLVLLRNGSPARAMQYFRAAYYAGNFNRKHLIGLASCLIKLNRYSEAETLLKTLSVGREASGENQLVILVLSLENDLRAGTRSKAEKTAARLLARYPLAIIGKQLVVGKDDLPIDSNLLKAFLWDFIKRKEPILRY